MLLKTPNRLNPGVNVVYLGVVRTLSTSFPKCLEWGAGWQTKLETSKADPLHRSMRIPHHGLVSILNSWVLPAALVVPLALEFQV